MRTPAVDDRVDIIFRFPSGDELRDTEMSGTVQAVSQTQVAVLVISPKGPRSEPVPHAALKPNATGGWDMIYEVNGVAVGP